jgi:hypothetical protein
MPLIRSSTEHTLRHKHQIFWDQLARGAANNRKSKTPRLKFLYVLHELILLCRKYYILNNIRRSAFGAAARLANWSQNIWCLCLFMIIDDVKYINNLFYSEHATSLHWQYITFGSKRPCTNANEASKFFYVCFVFFVFLEKKCIGPCFFATVVVTPLSDLLNSSWHLLNT